jgi:hypothetical protein
MYQSSKRDSHPAQKKKGIAADFSQMLKTGPSRQLVRPVMPIFEFSLAIHENLRLDCACTGHTGKTTIIKS